MRQNTNEQYRIVKYLFIFIHFVLILSLPNAGWYLDKFNRTSIPYLGFLSRSSTESDIIIIIINNNVARYYSDV